MMTTAIKRLTTLSVLLFVLFVGHGHTAGRPRQGGKPVRARLGREFTLRAGQRAALEGGGLRVRFASVENDSRCPVGVACVWAGNAEVLIEAEAGRSRAGLKLNTQGGEQYPREARHGRYTIELVALNPQPRADGQTKGAGYVATLVIRRT